MHSLAYGRSLLAENAKQEKILSFVNRLNIVLLNSKNRLATKNFHVKMPHIFFNKYNKTLW